MATLGHCAARSGPSEERGRERELKMAVQLSNKVRIIFFLSQLVYMVSVASQRNSDRRYSHDLYDLAMST